MLRRCTDHLTENAEHQAVAVLGIALTNIGTFVRCGLSECVCVPISLKCDGLAVVSIHSRGFTMNVHISYFFRTLLSSDQARRLVLK